MNVRTGALAGVLLMAVACMPLMVGNAIAQSTSNNKAMGVPGKSDTKAGFDAWMQGDYAKAVAIWRPLANAGDPDAQFDLGQAYKMGRGVPVDYPVAMDWYRKAAVQGHQRAQDNYGHLLFQLNHRAEAIPYLQRSVDRGDPLSSYFLGTALYNGDSVPQDYVRAYALMTRAASAGIPAATNSLATMDRYIPEKQRQQGLELAARMESSQQRGTLANAGDSGRYPTPVRTTDLPPSTSAAQPLPVPSRQPQPPVRPATPPPMATVPGAAIPPPVYRPIPPTQTQPAPVVRPRPTPVPPPAYTPAPAPAPRPAPAPAVAASVPAPAAGGWRVQLGVFSEEVRARNLWTGLIGRVAGLSSYQPYLVRQGSLTRLQAGPLASSTQAQKLCNAIKAAGSDCLIKAQ